jgi:hypothetical protein
MNDNVQVEMTNMDDGRWEDVEWVNEQAELSATMDAYEHSQAVG